ncbi:Transposase, Ptta/En/Spm, plant [Corchorus olitorius]|uniref:Transposase, Ptta/En/Spm, plant n=1 Tax=Corchorus olitorius TaxID=93759 RepID=A0A1R3IB91_9ROSI|nr:Transposase, Ptta/En/Spm, plant [Corchorus olitorius]
MAITRRTWKCVIVNRNNEPENQEGDLDQDPTKERRVRGPTKMADVWNPSPGRQIEVRFNTKAQPIGYEGRVLTSCLGTLARNCYLLPLSYRIWRKMPQMFKTDVLKRIEEKFKFSKRRTDWVFKFLGKKWKDYKAELQARYFTTINEDELLQNKPPDKMINRVEPNRVELFVMTRQHKDGSFVDEAAENAAKELNALMSERSSNVDEIFVQVMGKEHPGRDAENNEDVVKLREQLEAMTNKVAVLEEKADKVSELEVQVASLSKVLDASSSMAPQQMNKKARTYMEEPGMSSS